MSTTNIIHLLPFKFKVTCGFEGRYIKTHTNEKPSKNFNITFTILPFFQKKILKLDDHPEYFGTYYSWWNHQMRFKMIHFNIKMQNPELANLKCVTYTQPNSLSLIDHSYNWCIHIEHGVTSNWACSE